MTPLDEPGGNAVISIQEAEFAVQSSIAVLEEYKRKLQALLEAISLETSRSTSALKAVPAIAVATQSRDKTKMKTKSSVKKPTATKSSECPRMPQGKEMHVLGDWLLLVRAASVNVVESVQTWRRVVHQGRPQPFHHSYQHENESSGGGDNYLLTMCEDLNFLDNSMDLVEWLGFRLVRNPFIVHGAMDDVMSETLDKTTVHSARSLKYWSSASWQKQKNYLDKTRKKVQSGPESAQPCDQGSLYNNAANNDSNNSNIVKTRSSQWRARRSPPQALTKPLASILPEDDVVDGARIGAAQRVLLEEEAFHGRLRALRAIRQYLVDVSSSGDADTDNGGDNDSEKSTRSYASVYDEIADRTTQTKRLEKRLTLNERERNQVMLTIDDLKNQILWTQKLRELDLTKDHRIWRCRESYYKEVTRVFSVLSEELSKRLQVLTQSSSRTRELLEKQHDHLKKLLREKDKQRVERNDVKRREDELRRAEIRQKTAARTTKIKSKKRAKQPGDDTLEVPGCTSTTLLGGRTLQEVQEIANIVEQHALVPRENTATRLHTEQLERKRLAAILQRDLAREAHTRAIADTASELDRRRVESVHMHHEDELSNALERLARKKQQLRDLKTRLERIASTPVFTCVQQFSGKKLRVTIYEQRARGYILDGLRVVAYDPASSSSFPLVMTRREYTSFGYGRTVEGFSAFCKWLCLLYEKRKRHFRLVWSGPPCPPPLRVREYDSVLCIHKEGLKLSGRSGGFGYFLVAIFVRPTACTKLHFVASDLCSGKDPTCVEKVVLASNLLRASALQVQSCGHHHDGDSFVVWKHHRYDSDSDTSALTPNHQSHDRHGETRVYSGETRIHNRVVLVHVYDASPTEYIVEFQVPSTKKGSSVSLLVSSTNEIPTTTRLTLVKHEMNPYDVRLPSSAFGDLVASIDFAQLTGSSSFSETTSGVALSPPPLVTPKWMKKLTKYVRVLKMAKFGLRINCKFFLATLSVVQQKTEFRSFLLLELSCVSDLGVKSKKQSLRISLSEYLRCVNAARHILPINSVEDECEVCENTTSIHHERTLEECGKEIGAYKTPGSCSACAAIHDARLLAIRSLVTADHHDPVDVAQIDYHGHCQACGSLAKPVLVVLNCFTTAAAAGLLQLLDYYFSCFDMATLAAESGGAMAVVVIDELRQAIDVERIVVLFNADCGTTTAAASEFFHKLHKQLQPEFHYEAQQPFHAVFIVDNRAFAGHTWQQPSAAAASRDQDVAEALEALASAACHVGDQEPICENGGSENEDTLNFEAYLVTEALLIEATRVVLQPEVNWHKPGETVGASSWSAVCEFLADPSTLSARLQLVQPSLLPPSTQEILDAYFCHPKWPHAYEDVRPIFHALFCFMLHVSHVQHVVRGRGGILHDTLEIGILGGNDDRNDRISVISLGPTSEY